jgi:type IV secretory pathway VirB10-like protein
MNKILILLFSFSFFIEAETYNYNLDKDTNSKNTDLTRVILASTTIPCVMISALNSHIAGGTSCMVQRDMYGSHGSTLLIPKGSRVIGFYKMLGDFGAERLSIFWKRIITPRGSNINLTGAYGVVLIKNYK